MSRCRTMDTLFWRALLQPSRCAAGPKTTVCLSLALRILAGVQVRLPARARVASAAAQRSAFWS
eukprot:4817791-Pleurochrysis_carterae.AAC.1